MDVIPAVVNICDFHLKIYNMILQGVKPRTFTLVTTMQQVINVDYLTVIRVDFKALYTLSKRYKFITKRYSYLLDSMDRVIQSQAHIFAPDFISNNGRSPLSVAPSSYILHTPVTM